MLRRDRAGGALAGPHLIFHAAHQHADSALSVALIIALSLMILALVY